MNLFLTLSAVAAFGLALLVLLRQERRTVSVALGVGLALLGAEQAISAWTAGVFDPGLLDWWAGVHRGVTASAVACWVLVSVGFGRAFPDQFVRRWRPAVFGSVLALWTLILLPAGEFSLSLPIWDQERGLWVYPLAIRGYLFHLVLLLSATFILVHLEKTLRHSVGRVRWQIKFALLGMGAYFAARIYTSSQAILYRAWSSDLEVIHGAALLVMVALVSVSLRRAGTLQFDVYPSKQVLQGSITVVAVGIYLVAVGFAVQLLRYLEINPSWQHVLIFLALVLVTIGLLSDRLRQKAGLWTRRHFKRPSYDYRRVWNRFNERISGRMDEREVARGVAEVVATELEALSVSVVLGGEIVASTGEKELGVKRQELGVRGWELGESRREGNLEREGKNLRTFEPANLERDGDSGLGTVQSAKSEVRSTKGEGRKRDPEFAIPNSEGEKPPSSQLLTPNSKAPGKAADFSTGDPDPGRRIPDPASRYSLPLQAGDEVLGQLIVGERIRRRPLSYEDKELLQVMADQAAAVFQNIRMAKKLQEASEREAFQNMSAFFLHDLKNLANRLSLTVQNLPKHYDKPEFRREAFGVMEQSVEKIRGMCSRLSLLRDRLELDRVVMDFREAVARSTVELEKQVGEVLVVDLQAAGEVALDEVQFRKVVFNLVLNAVEAAEEELGVRSQELGDRSGGDLGLGTRDWPEEESDRKKQDSAKESPVPSRQSPVTIFIRTRRASDFAILEVEDNGPGMEPEFVEKKLFQPFQTTKKKGMGIGLFQSKTIVEEHGGRIEVESELGRGTLFRVRLPSVRRGIRS